jgi:hypothetical protein
MKNPFVIGLFATALLSSSLSAASPETFSKAVGDMAMKLNQPIKVKIVADEASGKLAVFDGETIAVPGKTLSLIKTDQEASALVALILGYQSGYFEPIRDKRNSTAASVIAFPLQVAAEGLSGSQGQDLYGGEIPNFSAEELRERKNQQQQRRAAVAISLAEKSGSCTGAMVDMLNRMRSEGNGAAALSDQPAGFARMVLKDMGSAAFPPDRSCI